MGFNEFMHCMSYPTTWLYNKITVFLMRFHFAHRHCKHIIASQKMVLVSWSGNVSTELVHFSSIRGGKSASIWCNRLSSFCLRLEESPKNTAQSSSHKNKEVLFYLLQRIRIKLSILISDLCFQYQWLPPKKYNCHCILHMQNGSLGQDINF